jgi:hypothetical protein
MSVLTRPLGPDPWLVRVIRRVEDAVLERCASSGVAPPPSRVAERYLSFALK